MTASRILVVDDEPDIRVLIKEILEDANYDVAVAEGASEADLIRNSFNPDLILLDIWMPPGPDGISLLKQWKNQDQMDIPVIMISGHGNIETAVEATQLGAYDFIEKPPSTAKLMLTIKHALENSSLQAENIHLRKYNRRLDVPIGQSKAMQTLKEQIIQIADHTTPVLITGEPGTGKELFARYLHKQSGRAKQAFVNVGVSVLSTENFLGDFFGNENDSKSGHGFFQQAEGGTLFLKDIADLQISLQAKLQNVLDNKYYTRVGSSQMHSFNIRIIAASSHDLPEMINNGQFRDDLYYQLNVLPIRIPALREHAEDIPALLQFYTNDFAQKEGLPFRRFNTPAQSYLSSYLWPGNIRELKNVVQRLLILGKKEQIDMTEIDLVNEKRPLGESTTAAHFDLPLRAARTQFEKEYLSYQLKLADGNVSKAAETAGMERTHLYRKLKSLGITSKELK